jgi:hypothetical protein
LRREKKYFIVFLLSLPFRCVGFPVGGDGGWADGIGVHMLVVGTDVSRTSGGRSREKTELGSNSCGQWKSAAERESRAEEKVEEACGRILVGVIMVGW